MGRLSLISYGIDNSRSVKREHSFDENNLIRDEITLYMGQRFEQVINTITTEIETKFQLTDYLTITLTNVNGHVRHFTQKDRMGSTTQILDSNGVVVHTKGYDAFGKPRNGDTWAQLPKPTLRFKDPNNVSGSIDITKRGFTDHEHLDAFELIHMNGRMYDFNNGRFLSVDPYIQGSTSQAINPYSYIQNNPLSGVDPTGYYIIPENCNVAEQNCSKANYTIKDMVDNLTGNTGDNGADRFQMKAAGAGKIGKSLTLADLSDINSQAEVNNCAGALTCYLIVRNPKTGKFEDKGETDQLGEYNFLNGILNDRENAGSRLGPVHLDESLIGESIDSFVLIHNPTEGMIKDGWETFKDKFFGHSKAAIQLSSLINQTNANGKTFNIVAHSQGTAILKSTVKHHMKNRGGKLSNLRVRLHGPAVNVSLARRTFRKAGISFFGSGGGVNINSGDAVPNIIGGNTKNPFHILKSLFLSPTLSSKIGKGSPHTFPVNCNEDGCK